MSYTIGSNPVPSRPKEQARYTIRELLILGLTLPVRFCPINKFGPEALALEVVSLERMNDSLLQYEREQLRQWRAAHVQAKRRAIEAERSKDEQGRGISESSSDGQEARLQGDAETTLIDESHGHRSINRYESYRHPSRQDALHFQIPPSHGGAPVNINIGLSLDYTSVPPAVKASSVQHPESTGTSSSQGRYSWNNKSQQSASLSRYLKDAPTSGKATTSNHEETSTLREPVIHGTPPPVLTSPDGHLRSHGGDTPNSMAVERATEPSLRSYSPTSSTRAPSDADYTETSTYIPVSPAPPMDESVRPLDFIPSMTPINESVATIVAVESPQGTLVASPDKEASHLEAADDYVVVSGVPPESVGTQGSVSDISGSWNAGSVKASASGSGNALLGRGKIDPKAQDAFIAFMMGKK